MLVTRLLRTAAIAASLLFLAPLAHADALQTVAEKSGFQKTGRYDEVIALCANYAAQWPDAVRCVEFGRTPEGRPMLMLVASRSGALTPEAAHAKGLPVLLVQGGIHAGEIDGKDAGFLALRELLEGRAAAGSLDRLVLVFVPVFNVDGHERYGRWNRPNQIGPEEMGWRTTAQNFNLNRDYMKADTPEMQAMLRLMHSWDPILSVDLHVTDGAKFEHDVAIQLEPRQSGDDALRKAGQALQDATLAALAQQGSLPLPYYPSFVVADDPSSGFEDYPSPPRFSSTYPALYNRYGLLVETHSWKDYPTRVRITRNTVVALAGITAKQGRNWLATAHKADQRASKLAGLGVPLAYKTSEKIRMVDFRGYEYSRKPSEISGALMTRYDDGKPQVWRLPMRDDVIVSVSAIAPTGGYLIPAAQADWLAPKLAQHGIAFQRIAGARPGSKVEAFRATAVTLSSESFESHTTATIEGRWAAETRDIAAGALYVPIAQPRARLVMGLLEPQAPDSYAAWGYFNNAFEQKEYMEDYVAEDVAREMLAKDPKLAAEFERRLATDPDFLGNPKARLAFFAQRHSSWDEQYRLYPVLRTAPIEP